MRVAALSQKPAVAVGGRFWEAWPPRPATLPGSSRRLAAWTVAAALLAHGGLLLAIVFFDPPPNLPGLIREIPVEVVMEPPVPEKRPVVADASEKSPTPQEATQDRPGRMGEPGQQQAGIDPEPKPGNKLLSGPGPGAKPAAPPAFAKRGWGPPYAFHKAITRREFADKDGQAETAPGGIGNRLAAGGLLMMPFDSGPDRSRAFAVPLPSESGGESMSYSVIVGGILERVSTIPRARFNAAPKGSRRSGLFSIISEVSRRLFCFVERRRRSRCRRRGPGRPCRSLPAAAAGAQQSFAIEIAFDMGS